MASLKNVAEEFINKKSRNQGVKAQRNKDADKKRQNLHLSKKTIETLWLNRTKTGETLSEAVDRLVLKHLGKKYSE